MFKKHFFRNIFFLRQWTPCERVLLNCLLNAVSSKISTVDDTSANYLCFSTVQKSLYFRLNGFSLEEVNKSRNWKSTKIWLFPGHLDIFINLSQSISSKKGSLCHFSTLTMISSVKTPDIFDHAAWSMRKVRFYQLIH